jgi:hypothetical protein
MTYPVLFDGDGTVLAQYNQVLAFDNTRYPQDWIIGSDGTVVYFSSTYEPALMIEVVEQELGLAD